MTSRFVGSYISFYRTFASGQMFTAFLVACALFAMPVVQAQERNLAPNFTTMVPNSKILLMPIDIELFSLSAGGVLEPKADWTAAALKHMTQALRDKKKTIGAQSLELKEAEADDFDEISSLHAAVAGSIRIHHMGSIPLPTKQGKLIWSLGDAVKPIHERTNADYGLFVWMRDSYATAERKALMFGAALLGVGVSGGFQIGYASLIDLRTGDVLWFNQAISGFGDVREAKPAAESIERLLANFPKTGK